MRYDHFTMLPEGAFEHIGDRKIKLYGGGNPISGITNSISKAIGTDGSGGGVLGALAKVDPGPAIGKGLASVDKFVNREIPGGWITVGGVTAGGLAIAYAPQVMALSAQSGVAPSVAAEALGIPGVVASGSAAGTPVLGSTAAGFGSIGSLGNAAQAASWGSGLSAAAPAAGTTFGALSSALPAGTVMGTGLNGGALGVTYLADAGGKIATMGGKAIPYSSVGLAGVAPQSGLSASSVLRGVKTGKELADTIMGGQQGKPNARQFAQFQAMNQVPMQQFGGIYRSNQNPFAPTPIMTVTDPDVAKKNDEESPNFGLADILRNFQNYG